MEVKNPNLTYLPSPTTSVQDQVAYTSLGFNLERFGSCLWDAPRAPNQFN